MIGQPSDCQQKFSYLITAQLGSTTDREYLNFVWLWQKMKWWCFRPLLCTLFRLNQADAGDNEAKLMTKRAPEWVRTSDPVIRSPARYRWTTPPPCGSGRITIFPAIHLRVTRINAHSCHGNQRTIISLIDHAETGTNKQCTLFNYSLDSIYQRLNHSPFNEVTHLTRRPEQHNGFVLFFKPR